ALCRGLRVAVVLQYYEQRQAPAHGQVEHLVNNALAEGPVAYAHRSHGSLAREALSQGYPRGNRNDAALNTIAEELPTAQMLAAAYACARAGALTHHLRDEA